MPSQILSLEFMPDRGAARVTVAEFRHIRWQGAMAAFAADTEAQTAFLQV